MTLSCWISWDIHLTGFTAQSRRNQTRRLDSWTELSATAWGSHAVGLYMFSCVLKPQGKDVDFMSCYEVNDP